jgi:hypothetical protein
MATVEITPVEVMALKKLAVINGALAKSISGQASVEQMALTRVLIDVVNRAVISKAEGRS